MNPSKLLHAAVMCIAVVCASGVAKRAVGQSFQANQTSGCSPLGIVINVTSPDPATIVSYNWSITRPDGTSQLSTSPTFIAIFSQPGSYDVTLTVNGAMTTTVNDYITVYGLPQANLSVDDPEGCFPLCVQFTDQCVPAPGSTIVEWSWDFGNGAVSSQQNPAYCYPNAGTFTPVLSVEDNHGCYDDITVSGLIDVSSVFPQAAFALSSALECNPPVAIGFDNNSSGSGALTSTWDFGDGSETTAAGVNNTSHTFLATGNFNACLTVADAVGCEDTECLPLTIFSSAQASYSVSSDEVCEGESVTFTDTTVPVPLAWQWDLNGDGTTDATTQNGSFAYNQAGSYTPALIVTYSTTCADTLSGPAAIGVLEGITAAFTADTTESCMAPFQVEFTNESTGPGTLSYNWYINGSWVSSAANAFSHTFTANGNYDISLEVSNQFGCTDVLVLNDYIVVQPPAIALDIEPSVCTGQNIDILLANVSTVDPVVDWMWDFDGDGITDATGPDPAYAYDTPGMYAVSLSILTSQGCTASETADQPVTAVLQVSTGFTANTNYACAGDELEFCVEYQPGNTYSWNFGDNTGWHAYAYFDTCVTHDYSDTGYFDVALSVFNGTCSMMVSYPDFMYIVPPVALFDYTTSCDNYLSLTFTDQSIMADSLVWDFGDGTPLVINETNPTHLFPGPGDYEITLTAFNDTIADGCPDSKVLEISVEPVNLTLNLAPTTGCPPLMVSMSDNGSNQEWEVSVSNGDHIHAVWNQVLNKYVVTYQHDGISTTANYGLNANFWPTLSFEDAGYFDITVIGTNWEGCTDTLVYEDVIFVASNPDFASFSYDLVDVCDSVHIGFIPDLATLTNPQWTFSSGYVTNEQTPYVTFSEPFNYDEPITVTLSAYDALGCYSQVTQNLSIDYPAIPYFLVANDPSCQNDTVSFLNQSIGNIAAYTWDFGDPLSGVYNTSNLPQPSHDYGDNGTYAVCLTVENPSGCSRTYCNADAVHIVNPEIDFTYTSSINNCLYGVQFENSTLEVDADIVMEQWDFGDGQLGEGNMVYHTYSIGVYNVVLVVMNEYACIDTLEVPDILNFGEVIGPFSQALDTALCAPYDVDFSAFNVGDTYFDYFWDFDDGYGDPGGSTTTAHTYDQTGTYCPSIIMTDPNGCPVLISCTDSIEVEAYTLSYSAIEQLCYGDSLHLSITNAEQLLWEEDTYVELSGPEEFKLFPPQTTNFVLTGYYSDCQTTDTLQVVVHPLPVVALDLAEDVCQMDAPFQVSGGLPADPPGVYYIDGLPQNVFDPTTGEGMAHPVVYAYTDLNGCTNTDTVDVFVHPLPTVTLEAFDEYCENDPVIAMEGGTPLGGQYLFGANEIFVLDPSDGDGVFSITYFYTDGYGCSSSDNTDLVIHPAPDADISYSDLCLGDTLQPLNASWVPYESIAYTEWNYGDQGIFLGYESPEIIYPAIGNYPLTVIMSTPFGCTTIVDTTVNVWATPSAAFTTADGCQDMPLVFYNTSGIEAGSIVETNWTAEGTTVENGDSLVHAFAGWGELPVLLEVTSDRGCYAALTQYAEVFPTPQVSITAENSCYDEASQFYAYSSVGAGWIAAEDWSVGDSQPVISAAGAAHVYSAPGDYAVSFTATSDRGCTYTATDTITVYPLPEISFTGGPETLCAGNEVGLSDESTIVSPHTLTGWLWMLGDSVMGHAPALTFIADTVGIFDVYLEVWANTGCARDTLIPQMITVFPKPQAGFSVTPEEAPIYEPFIEIEDLAGADVIQWHYDLGDGSQSADSALVHAYSDYGSYYITQIVTNSYGCMDTAWRAVEVLPETLVFLPNAFTPDNDGINDGFRPVFSGFEPTLYEFTIWNRWGEAVFFSNDPEEAWMGNVRNSEYFTPDGIYTWMLKIRAHHDVTIRLMQGHVTLMR